MSETTRTAVRAAVAAGLAIAAAPLVVTQRPYWMILIAVVVLNDTWGSSLRKTWQRIGMTGAGCVAGWGLHYISDGYLAAERALLLTAVFFAAFFRKSSYPWMTFFITVYVAFLITVLGQWSTSLMIARLEDTVLGGVIALVASLLIPAPRVGGRVEEELARFWSDCRAQVAEGFEILQSGSDPDENWRTSRRDLLRRVEQAQIWARETDYETLLKFRSLRRNRRIFRNTVMLCHQSLGFNRMARLVDAPFSVMNNVASETLRRFDLLFSPQDYRRKRFRSCLAQRWIAHYLFRPSYRRSVSGNIPGPLRGIAPPGHSSPRLRIFGTIEERALRYGDPVERLRYLRNAANRRARYAGQAAMVVRVSVAATLLSFGGQLGRSRPVPLSVAPRIEKSPAISASDTPWVVQETDSRVLFSNGLTILRDYETASIPRRYRVYDRDSLAASSERFDRPAGIVFHTTESEILPLDPSQRAGLLRTRESVLEHVRKQRCYNFVIDRFGQVYRIVPETQTAHHAGHSIWGSERSVWIGLNESFIGVSFEAQSASGFTPSPAQIHAAKLLTEILRARYRIPDENCVTHAQVSVNPDNMRIGYHTDWGSSFPFAQVGLIHGYDSPLASIEHFGFEHDDAFLKAAQGMLWPGIQASDNGIADRAARQGLTRKEFRTRLQHQFKTLRRSSHD